MFDVLVNGMALNNQGLTDTNQVSGLGLVTYGNIWPCKDFWFDNALSSGAQGGVSTVWTGVGVTISTTWSLVGASISTTWQNVGVSISTSWTLCGASISTSWTLVTDFNSCTGE